MPRMHTVHGPYYWVSCDLCHESTHYHDETEAAGWEHDCPAAEGDEALARALGEHQGKGGPYTQSVTPERIPGVAVTVAVALDYSLPPSITWEGPQPLTYRQLDEIRAALTDLAATSAGGMTPARAVTLGHNRRRQAEHAQIVAEAERITRAARERRTR